MAAAARRVTIPYSPRAIFGPFHARTKRWSIEVAHRRAGKTVARVNDLIKRSLECPLVEPHFAYVAPTFTQAKDIAWNYLKRYTAPIPDVEVNEAELRVDLPGKRRIRLYGAENYDRMRGIYLDGIVLDEYPLIDPRAWSEVIRPALSDRKGWADFTGTPSGYNHFHDMYFGNSTLGILGAVNDPDWHHAMHKASETGILDPAELADARKSMTQEQYDQEYECSFSAAIRGAYYGKEMAEAQTAKRITRVPHDPAFPVQTWWDLGYDDSTTIWFVQYIAREVRVIDYEEGSGEDIPFYAKALDRRPYRYSQHVLPHDGGAKTLAAGGKSVQMILGGLGFRNTKVVPVTDDLLPDIAAVRLLLPRCWFDAEKCARGLEALRQYRADWDEKNKILKNRPLHNWASHGADAFRTGAVGGGDSAIETFTKKWPGPKVAAGTRAWI